MKHTLRTRSLLLCLSITVLATVNIIGQAQVDRAKVTLPEKDLFSKMSVDEGIGEAPGLPRADLVIKDMCFENGAIAGYEYVGILLANIGTVDAGPFELGIDYVKNGSSTFAKDSITGLRAGEETWLKEWHYCCGWSPVSLVASADRFSAIADPKYYKKDPNHFYNSIEVKGTIPEMNERNNQMAVNKSDLKPCTKVTKVDRPAPAGVKTIKPQILKP